MLSMNRENNNAQSSAWLLDINGLEGVTFKLRDFQVPAVTLGRVELGNRDVFTAREPGNVLTFDDMPITFIVDESRRNYNAMLGWMFRCSKAYEERGIVATMLDNEGKKTEVAYEFFYSFPTMVGPLIFDVENETPDILATANISYSMFMPIDKDGKPMPGFEGFI